MIFFLKYDSQSFFVVNVLILMLLLLLLMFFWQGVHNKNLYLLSFSYLIIFLTKRQIFLLHYTIKWFVLITSALLKMTKKYQFYICYWTVFLKITKGLPHSLVFYPWRFHSTLVVSS